MRNTHAHVLLFLDLALVESIGISIEVTVRLVHYPLFGKWVGRQSNVQGVLFVNFSPEIDRDPDLKIVEAPKMGSQVMIFHHIFSTPNI